MNENKNEDLKKKEDNKELKDDNRSLSEKIDDAMDNAVGGAFDFFYGKRKDYTHDIPATMPDPNNEIRHINKVQTRRNFNKRFAKSILKIFFIILALGIIAYILIFIIGLFFS